MDSVWIMASFNNHYFGLNMTLWNSNVKVLTQSWYFKEVSPMEWSFLNRVNAFMKVTQNDSQPHCILWEPWEVSKLQLQDDASTKPNGCPDVITPPPKCRTQTQGCAMGAPFYQHLYILRFQLLGINCHLKTTAVEWPMIFYRYDCCFINHSQSVTVPNL